MWKRKVSLFDVVDDSLALAKKDNGSLNGGNNMTSSTNKLYEKPHSQRFYEILEKSFSSGMASKRGVLKLMNIQSSAMPSPSPAVVTRKLLRWLSHMGLLY